MGADKFASMPSTNGVEGLTTQKFFRVGYDASNLFGIVAATNLWSVIDDVFNQCQQWFVGVDLGASTRFPLPITVIVWTTALSPDKGATWFAKPGQIPRIQISSSNIFPANTDNNRLLWNLMAELSEMFMDAQDAGWFAGSVIQDNPNVGFTEGSIGEGLSHYCANEYAKLKRLKFGDDFANIWMATNPRDASRINASNPITDEGKESACSLLFIYYLHSQLGFSTVEIISHGDTNPADATKVAKLSLADVYRNLTQDESGTDPSTVFMSLLENKFPAPTKITSPHDLDNPFPLVTMSFANTQTVFGAGDVWANTRDIPGEFTNTCFLQVEGLSLFTLGFVNIGLSSPDLPELVFRPSRGPPPITFDRMVPQTFTFVYNMFFGSLAFFPRPGQGAKSATLVATLDFTDQMPFLPTTDPDLRHNSVSLPIALTASHADPHFNNSVSLPTGGTNPWNLSYDLRIFTATPRRDPFPVKVSMNDAPFNSAPEFHIDTSTSNFEADDSAFAWQYLHDLLAWLNKYYSRGGSSFTNPFRGDVVPQSPSELTQPSTITNWTHWFIQGGTQQVRAKNYHFAIARVRLDGSPGFPSSTTTVAPMTEVFFRHFVPGSNVDTTFNEAQRYRTNRSLGPRFPIATPGSNLPLFGSKVTEADLLSRPDGTEFGEIGINEKEISVGNGVSGAETWCYFGCFMDWLGSSGGMLPTTGSYPFSLVAQIDFPPVWIMDGESPQSSTKLAQRNVMFIDN